MFFSLQEQYCAAIIGATGGIGHALGELISRDPRCGLLARLSRQSEPAIDFNDEDSLVRAARHFNDQNIQFDALIIATGVLTAPDGTPPEKAFRDLKAETLQQILAVNTVGPALALKHFLPLLPRKNRCLVATLSARVGSIGDNDLGGWISYRTSKAALNQITRTAAIEQKRRNPESVCVALHPGTIETDLSRPLARGKFTHSPEACARNLISVLDTLPADQTGRFFDYAGSEVEW